MCPAPPSGAREKRGGFTLLELIVVLALLVALTGLTLPALLTRVAGSSREAVETRLRAAARICRAEAQREGSSRQLASRVEDGRTLVVSREVMLDQDGQRSNSAEVLLELPPGYAICESRPGAASDGDSGRESGEATQVTGQSPEWLVLAEFLADGSASVPGALYLEIGETLLEIRIARWTGALTLAAAEAEAESGLPDPAEELDPSLAESEALEAMPDVDPSEEER